MKQIALSLFVIAASGAYVWEQAGKAPADDMLGTALPAEAADGSSLQPAIPAARAQDGPVPAAAKPLLENNQQGVQLKPLVTTQPVVGRETTSAISASAPKALPAARPPQIAQVPAALPEPPAVVDPAPSALSFVITPAVYIPIPQPRPAYLDAPARIIRAGMKLTVHRFADGTYTGPVTDAYYGLIQIQASIQGGRLTALKVLKYPSDRRTSISINRQALPMLRDEAISAQSANVDIISGATLTSKAFVQSLGGALKKASS